MEVLLELIADLLFEGGVEYAKSDKSPKIFKYFVLLIFLVISIGLFVLMIILKSDIYLFTFFGLLGLFMTYSSAKLLKSLTYRKTS